jgi:glycosyltransferase involved in cell wall biosynthesis
MEYNDGMLGMSKLWDDTTMKVTYSGKMDIGGGGIGTTAWHQVKPLIEEGVLDSVYAPKGKLVPEKYMHVVPEVNAPAYDIGDIYFDGWCAINMEYPEILQSWMMHSLFQIEAFPKSKNIVNLYSAHPVVQASLMQGEPGYTPNPVSIKKGTQELEKCDYIFVPSEFVYNSLRQFHLEKKAKIVPFGVDLNKFAFSERPRDFKVIFVGENWSRKGLQYLLAAWYKLKLKNAKLVVAGINEGWAAALNPKNDPSVKIGWVDDLVKEYQSSSVFCLPAVEDGCPLACYEAMSCGLPVIITKTTGTYQHVFNGTQGFIIEPKSVSGIMECLQILYQNYDLVCKMGKNSRKMMESFPWERHEQEYVKWIKSL